MDDEYMTTDEFARLPAVVHHAVWAAWSFRRIDSVPAARGQSNGMQRYRRVQVEEIMRELEEDRG